MTTPTETELKKLPSHLPNKFAMIYTFVVCVMWPNKRGANEVGAPLKFRKRKEN